LSGIDALCTGRTFDWDLAIKAKEFGIPTILSGGLNPDTISEAISLVKPFGVDVNSGIEESPGKKSPNLMGEVMEIIRKMES
jgi:phosphoribosylanthranilate isomerase